jgi:Tol biopolymer transport system component
MTAVILFALVTATGNTQDSVKFGEPMCIGYGASLQWSPDGSMLAYVTTGSLYVITPPEFKNPRLIAADIAPFQWVGNVGFVWKKDMRRQHEDVQWYCTYIFSSDLAGNVELLDSDSTRGDSRSFGRIGKLMPAVGGTIAYHEILNGDRHNTRPKILRQTALSKPASPAAAPRRMAFSRFEVGSSGDIWLANLDGSEQRQVTHGPDKWMWALLSPNQALIASKNSSGEVIILDSTGVIRGNAGRADLGSWNPNSNLLLVFVTEEDDLNIYASDLFIYYVESNELRQLTATPDLIEEQPAWSPAGIFIAYVATNTRQIFVMPVEDGE